MIYVNDVVVQIIVIFLSCYRALVTKTFVMGLQVNRLSNTFKKFYGRHTDPVGQYKKTVCQILADCTS